MLAHNCVDRDRECFDESLLAAFAASIPGKGCHIRHPAGWDGDSGPAEGRVFEAEVRRMSLEQAIAYIEDDELVEVTPSAVRLRKRYLDPHERKKHARRAESEAA